MLSQTDQDTGAVLLALFERNQSRREQHQQKDGILSLHERECDRVESQKYDDGQASPYPGEVFHVGTQYPKGHRQQNEVHYQECQVGGAIRQQRKRNEEQCLVGRTDKRKRPFVIANQHILKLLLRAGIVQLRGVAGSDHVACRIELSEVGVAMQQRGGEKGDASQQLNADKDRR